jgi:outer membrane receptor protein involved in Fe transport
VACCLLTFYLFFTSPDLHAQGGQPAFVTGIVTSGGDPVETASVCWAGTTLSVATDREGKFRLDVPANTHTLLLKVSLIGYKTREIPIAYPVTTTFYEIEIEEDAHTLNEVLITGKSATRKINELAYNVVAVEVKQLHNTTMDLSHALDRVSGVRIRESGGVGSGFNFSLNGFTGRQVKFFIDGVPMENFGSSFQINNIPINLAERIEVYKGVVPISFGSDALGGAVNIVTGSRR